MPAMLIAVTFMHSQILNEYLYQIPLKETGGWGNAKFPVINGR